MASLVLEQINSCLFYRQGQVQVLQRGQGGVAVGSAAAPQREKEKQREKNTERVEFLCTGKPRIYPFKVKATSTHTDAHAGQNRHVQMPYYWDVGPGPW